MKGSSKAGFHVWCMVVLGMLVCSYTFVVAPFYDTDTGAGQEVDGNDMWLTVNENGEYVIHFMQNGELIEQIVEEKMISKMEAEMEVRKE